MTTLHLFKSKAKQMGYVLRSGKSIHFQNHQYATEDVDEIAELTKECNRSVLGPGNYYVDQDQLTIESEALVDPHYLLREQIRAEELAKLIANNINKDGGNYDAGKLNAANSSMLFATQTTGVAQAMAANPQGNAGLAPGTNPSPAVVAGDKPAGFVKVNLPT